MRLMYFIGFCVFFVLRDVFLVQTKVKEIPYVNTYDLQDGLFNFAQNHQVIWLGFLSYFQWHMFRQNLLDVLAEDPESASFRGHNEVALFWLSSRDFRLLFEKWSDKPPRSHFSSMGFEYVFFLRQSLFEPMLLSFYQWLSALRLCCITEACPFDGV